MKNPILIGLIICISMICIHNQSIAQQKNCVADLTEDAVMTEVILTHYIFTGSDTTGLHVKSRTIIVSPGERKLVKKRKKDCNMPNPQDCYQEVMEEIPPVTMNLYTLSGPDVTPHHEVRKEKTMVLKKAGGTVSREVVCPKNRSRNLIKKVQTALSAMGYPVKTDGNPDQATQLALTDFQKSKGLAYGDLSLETLAALNVR